MVEDANLDQKEIKLDLTVFTEAKLYLGDLHRRYIYAAIDSSTNIL